MKYIGDDRREAIDWLQDRLSLTRPDAEGAMISLLREKIAITTDKGIFLTEEEEEAEKQAKKFSQRMHSRKAGTKSKVNRSRKGMRTSKIVKTDFSSVADHIMNKDDDDKK